MKVLDSSEHQVNTQVPGRLSSSGLPNPWDDPDSPDRPNLTALGLRRWLNVGEKWVENHTLARRIPGQRKVGKYWRYEKAAIELQILATGQALKPIEMARKVRG